MITYISAPLNNAVLVSEDFWGEVKKDAIAECKLLIGQYETRIVQIDKNLAEKSAAPEKTGFAQNVAALFATSPEKLRAEKTMKNTKRNALSTIKGLLEVVSTDLKEYLKTIQIAAASSLRDSQVIAGNSTSDTKHLLETVKHATMWEMNRINVLQKRGARHAQGDSAGTELKLRYS